MLKNKLTKDALAVLLIAAEKAHAEYEKTLGHRDNEWAAWYAEYMIEQLVS